jgi:hypothetical protein
MGLAAYFFDGTGNHPHPKNLDGTPNFKTNVRKLFEVVQGKAFYAYGIGSGYNADGTLTTKGVMKEGATGFSMKARTDWMIANLESQLATGDKVVDVFGFSRGSATASYFLNRIQEQVNAGNPLYKDINIRFVALFDQVPSKLGMGRTMGSAGLNVAFSVASIGFIGYNPYNRICDKSGEFSFTLPKGMKPGTMLHLVALDEQRREFAVTDIQGALQVGFRGVHSDDGGGYENNFFEYITRRFVYERAKAAGLQFFDSKYHALNPNAMVALYDQYAKDFSSGTLPQLGIYPTDNSALIWDDNEKRRLPKGMFLHPSIQWFSTPPANSIKGYQYLP